MYIPSMTHGQTTSRMLVVDRLRAGRLAKIHTQIRIHLRYNWLTFVFILISMTNRQFKL